MTRTATAVAAGLLLLAAYCLMTATTTPYARYAVGCGGDPALAPLRFDFALDVAPGHAAVPSLEVDGHEVRRHHHRGRVAKSFPLSEILPRLLELSWRVPAVFAIVAFTAAVIFNSHIVSTVFVVAAALLTVGAAGFAAHVALQSNPAAIAAMPLPESLPEAAAAHAALTKEILRAHEHPPSVAGDETSRKTIDELEHRFQNAVRAHAPPHAPAHPQTTTTTIGAACLNPVVSISAREGAWRLLAAVVASLLAVYALVRSTTVVVVVVPASSDELKKILAGTTQASHKDYGTV